MTTTWPRVRVGDLLRRASDQAVVSPQQLYREVTVRLWGRGVVQRRVVLGTELNEARRLVAKAGQFILSRIDARNGAIGVVPAELDGALVTNDFPVFEVDRTKLEPSFLAWLSKTPAFVELCRRASEGTTNRVRLKENRFLALEVPVPPLAEQQRIVARIESIARHVDEARLHNQEIMRETEAFVASFHLKLSRSRIRKLGDIVLLDEQAVPVDVTVEYPQAGVKSFGLGLFPKTATRGLDTTYRTFNRLYKDALVLSQVKAWEGAVAVCDGDLEGWYVSPEYRTFRCVPSEARPGYLRALVRTQWFWGQLGGGVNGGLELHKNGGGNCTLSRWGDEPRASAPLGGGGRGVGGWGARRG